MRHILSCNKENLHTKDYDKTKQNRSSYKHIICWFSIKYYFEKLGLLQKEKYETIANDGYGRRKEKNHLEFSFSGKTRYGLHQIWLTTDMAYIRYGLHQISLTPAVIWLTPDMAYIHLPGMTLVAKYMPQQIDYVEIRI